MTTSLILDVDTGIDDALAILFAVKHGGEPPSAAVSAPGAAYYPAGSGKGHRRRIAVAAGMLYLLTGKNPSAGNGS